MNNLKVVDVRLRDGGCVNNFNFGQACMESILYAQEAAGIDIIEMGYIDEKNGSDSERTQYKNEKVIPKCILNLNYSCFFRQSVEKPYSYCVFSYFTFSPNK